MNIGAILKWWGSVTADSYRPVIAYVMLIVSSLALFPAIDEDIQGDIRLYENVAHDLATGKLPYRDRVLEYPPYVIPVLLLPLVFEGKGISYSMLFKYQTLLADLLLKLILFGIALNQTNKLRGAFSLMCYCLGVPFLQFFFLQRYDVWPALISVGGVWLFSSGRFVLSGLCFAVGVGVKVYPVVFLPPLFLLAARQGKARQFVGGLVAGLMPIILLGFWLPWWRFAEFHGARGLQCESLYASLIWFAKRIGLVQAEWLYTKSWFEVQGFVADSVLPWARRTFVAAVVFSVGWATWVAACCEKLSIGRLARLLMIPLLGFVAFNQVLSPQYMVWILPIAALGLLDGAVATILLLTLATLVTHIIFPSFHDDYSKGLNFLETTVLLLRNLSLITVWGLLIHETSSEVRRAGRAPILEIGKSILKLFWSRRKLDDSGGNV